VHRSGDANACAYDRSVSDSERLAITVTIGRDYADSVAELIGFTGTSSNTNASTDTQTNVASFERLKS
jgi:hypothetical protein